MENSHVQKMTSMNIGIVCYPTFGGSGVVATELGHYLAKKGHKVHFITYNQPVRLDILDPNIYYHEVNVHDYPLFKYQPYELALSSAMVDAVLREKLDVLHVHYAIPHAYAAYTAKQILKDRGVNIPIVTTLHGTDITLVGKNPSYKPAVTFSINHSDAVTSVSESLKEDTQDFFGITRDIEVIPNFVDLELYKGNENCARAQLAEEGEKLITHISNFRPVKRTQDVVSVFKAIHDKMPSKLLLIGDGPERSKTEDMARNLGLERDVIFLGKTTEVHRVLCSSDLFVLPSMTESFGLAALEAMAAKVPVISTDTGGLPEVNVHGVTGFTSPVGDVEDMAKNAMEILSSEEVHKGFKERAFERASQFTIDEIGPKYESLYQQVVG
ncbi:MAG: N-acetyl-alpha-D-glucosaminyl L-malate synthase BshA [Schleiferiaceae bacterium]